MEKWRNGEMDFGSLRVQQLKSTSLGYYLAIIIHYDRIHYIIMTAIGVARNG
jgi:hypothetical protein